jgi:FtsH-binding integral membrane protein
MLYLAIGLFVLAAVFGLILLTAILRNQPTPKPVVFIHGGLAVTALLLVIFFIVRNNGEGPVTSLILFILAAVGGLTLFSIDIRNKPVPKWLAVIHPIVAALGLLTLIIYVMR